MSSLSSSQSELAAHAATISPFKEVWTIAWPTVLRMTSYTIMQFTDKLMVGQVSPKALAAQTSGAIWSFAMLSFAMGILTVVNTYVSQNLGAGTPRNGPKYAWAAFWLGLLLWAFVMVPYALLLPWIFSTVLPASSAGDGGGLSAELLQMEVGYAQILIFGSIVLLAGRGLNQFFFGLHKPRIVTIGAIAANITNVIGNYVLVFGENGIPGWGIPGVPGVPPLGVYGAAIGTVIGSSMELLIPALLFLGPKMNAQFGTRSGGAWRFRFDTIRDLLRIGWPAAIQWGNELVCWAIFMTILVGAFGEDHITASAIAFGYMSLSFMPAVGFSVATNSLVGKYIGAGQPEVAVARTRLTLTLAMIYMSICAAVFVLFRHQLVALFIGPDASPEQAQHIIAIGAKLMICTAVFQVVDAVGVIYTGALRGAGDTVWPGVMTCLYSWVFIVGGGWFVAQGWPGLESLGPWIAAAVYIIVYGVTMRQRFASGRWRSIKLLKTAVSGPSEALREAINPGGAVEPVVVVEASRSG